MGISSTTNRVSYIGDGSSATFSYPYEFTAPADLKVYIYNSSLQSATLQVLNTNYTIGGTANAQGIYTQGGSVIFTSSIPTGLYTVIARDPSQVQSYALLQNGNINSTALVQQFDYVTLLIQRLQDEASRACRFADGYAGTLDITVPSGSKAGMYMQVDSSGLHLEWTSSTLYYGSPGLALIGNGSTAPATFQALSLVGSTVIGVLAPQNGGTGFGGTWTPFAVVYASSATSLTQVPNAGAGLVLTTNASSAPTWQAPQVSQSGILPVVNGGTGVGLLPTGVLLVMSSATQATGFVAGGTDQVLIGATGVLPIWGQVNIASNSSVVGVLAIANGGTGQASKAPAFNALSPATVMGDMSWFNGSSNVKLAIGTNNQVATVSGSSVVWANSQLGTATQVLPSSANYSVLPTDNVILVQSGCAKVSLFDTSGNTGKPITIVKDFAGTSPITIVGSSCTIDGSSVTLSMQYESKTVYPDGTGNNWKVIDAKYPQIWNTYTPIVIQGMGSSTNISFLWMRKTAGTILVKGTLTTGVPSVSALAGFTLPSGFPIDAGKLSITNNTGSTAGTAVGWYSCDGGANQWGQMVTAPLTAPNGLSGFVFLGGAGGSTNHNIATTGSSTLIATSVVNFELEVPVTNWT